MSRSTDWGTFPYLDRDLALLPKNANRDDWISRIHVFNYGAVLSHGYHVGDIGSHADCVARLTEGIADRLFAEEAGSHLAVSGLGRQAKPNRPDPLAPTSPTSQTSLPLAATLCKERHLPEDQLS